MTSLFCIIVCCECEQPCISIEIKTSIFKLQIWVPKMRQIPLPIAHPVFQQRKTGCLFTAVSARLGSQSLTAYAYRFRLFYLCGRMSAEMKYRLRSRYVSGACCNRPNRSLFLFLHLFPHKKYNKEGNCSGNKQTGSDTDCPKNQIISLRYSSPLESKIYYFNTNHGIRKHR